jgi:transposase
VFPRESRGRQWRDHRTIVNGIFWILFSGAPWRDLPERYGSWQTGHRRFTRWRKDGTWDKALAKLQLKADRGGLLDYAQ